MSGLIFAIECWGLRGYFGALRSLSLYARRVRRRSAELRKEPQLSTAAVRCSPCPAPPGFCLLWTGEGQILTGAVVWPLYYVTRDPFLDWLWRWVTQVLISDLELSVRAGQSRLSAGLRAVSILPDLAGTGIHMLPGKTHPPFPCEEDENINLIRCVCLCRWRSWLRLSKPWLRPVVWSGRTQKFGLICLSSASGWVLRST